MFLKSGLKISNPVLFFPANCLAVERAENGGVGDIIRERLHLRLREETKVCACLPWEYLHEQAPRSSSQTRGKYEVYVKT